ncbi:TPA: hypothetical protein ACPDW7_001851 [Pasteurella multocida]|uniref:hypothetical protein n=1 Tax=Pasteurella multocida TaxID=747 RepID=UPI0032FE6863|nr:hypothetical protein [Pasteurella multocida]HDR1432930.1 hypothetical protein [Pasteurella multocida]HDR1791953.1 hypothetical protein [Pasteurella multocida]HDR1830067.1 hypothetical protein [Pasteurella multocida]HDR1857135.1 hypothetical protein [Pasteurella multocida]
MSGSGNTSFPYNPVFNNISNSNDDSGIGYGAGSQCENLIINTQLISPKPNVISQLRVGDDLSLAISSHTQDSITINAFKDGKSAGAIIVPQLLPCMSKGYEYIAEVLSINHGQVKLCIKRI